MEEGSFATCYIPIGVTTVTRAGDFTSIAGPNFSSWYNPVEGTFGVEFQTIFTTDSIPRYILTGDQNKIMYLEANTGTMGSFDGQVHALSRSVSASGVLTKAYLGYWATGRVIVGARSHRKKFKYRSEFLDRDIASHRLFGYRSVLWMDKEHSLLSDPVVGCRNQNL
jgi:hypothetical protein